MKETPGSVIPFEMALSDQSGFPMPVSNLTFSTSNPQIAEVDELQNFYAKKPGVTNLIVKHAGQSDRTLITAQVEVVKNPVETIDVSVEKSTVRTGDVIRFEATARDRRGKPVEGVPLSFAVSGEEEEKGRKGKTGGGCGGGAGGCTRWGTRPNGCPPRRRRVPLQLWGLRRRPVSRRRRFT